MKKSVISAIMTGVLVLSMSVQGFARTALCVGADSRMTQSDGIDTATTAKRVSDILQDGGYFVTCLTQPTSATISKKLQSDFLFFDGHGNYDHIGWNYNKSNVNACAVGSGNSGTKVANGVSYSTVGLLDNDISKVSIAVFGGCNTADESHLRSSIAYTSAGPNKISSTIGWKDYVNTTSLNNWLESFVYYLTFAYSMTDAAAEADNDIDYYDNRVYKHFIGGNAAQTLYNTKSVLNDTVPSNMYRVNSDTSFDFDLKNVDGVAAYIKENHVPEFDLEQYQILYHDYTEKGETGTIIFQYSIGDFITEKKIVVLIENNKIKGIFLNHKPDAAQASSFVMPISDIAEDELKQNALKELEKIENEFEVVNQTVEKRYHLETKKASYIVFTDYKVGDYSQSALYEYEL